MATCAECGAILAEDGTDCPSCAPATANASGQSVSRPSDDEGTAEEPSLFSTIVGVLGWLVLMFIAFVVVITFYAAVAAGSLAMGVPLNGGIAIATAILVGIVSLGVWLYLRRKRRSA